MKFLFEYLDTKYLQHIANDANAPHISAVGDAVKVYHFGRHKLRCAKENLKEWYAI